ncbi:hypothetical protein IL308_06185 [Lactococcus lactis]|uniref:hypothetical protein n=1 Tax=Lactococcus lactis TaxID=1358 RepID=UPI001911B236|nr:hypothetical protein [Lactococcus lactis]MBK5076378.1 hypothetical protein [Lactococcus lactis]
MQKYKFTEEQMKDRNKSIDTPFNKFDIKILKYIDKFDEIKLDDINKKFPKIEFIDYHISKLEKALLILSETAKNSTGGIYSTGIYSIKPLGKARLQEYKSMNREKRWNYFFKSIFTPIIVAILTTLITTLLLG